METIATFTSTAVFTILEQTKAAFAPLLKRDEIDAVPKKTFAYGSAPRHQLDVYYPKPRTDGSKPPVVHFVYGGGFVSGDRATPDYWCQNVGAFWATRGFVSVISDYRLVPNVQWPGPPADIRDAMSWVVDNLADVADVSRYFFIAHSAGGTHLATTLAHPLLVPDHLLQRIKGVVLICPIFTYPTAGPMAPLVLQYCGTEEAMKLHSPQALLEAVPAERAALWPAVRLLVAEREDQSLVGSHPLYVETLKKKGIKIEEGVIPGHNHISVNIGLFTGQGEEWTKDQEAWFKSF
ncbi:alpha/beta-hydrolase [Exidia glandulosa HHB12029]|uniref:Alpha/beta-hydrolase n=1 Tax=Exidia glandulosa HHB12029 TaxID=1314781 RepID=A0A165DKD6_EXIGL|nr:alpha/beta-hydrolase [Exidia glandulosa HHB12029]